MPEYLAGVNFPVPSLARWILAKIEETYVEQAAVATPLPARRLVTIGSVSVDEPLLAVMFGGTHVGPPGNELTTPLRSDVPRTAEFNVELWRPIETSMPGGFEPASAADVSAYSEVVMQDAWLLLDAAYKCDQLGIGVIASISVNEPTGDTVGCTMGLSLQIP
jgi:hypothetical protein